MIEQNFLGFTCGQCHATMVFLEGALSHQFKIWNNNGECPEAIDEDNEL